MSRLHELPQVIDRALEYCLKVTGSESGFVGLLNASGQMMEVAAIKGTCIVGTPRMDDRGQGSVLTCGIQEVSRAAIGVPE